MAMKEEGGEPNMRMNAHVPSRMRREITGVRPQPLRSATRNFASVRRKRTVSNEIKATLWKIDIRIVKELKGSIVIRKDNEVGWGIYDGADGIEAHCGDHLDERDGHDDILHEE
jgi:hypothetical protein